jgi:hypothetical protein
VSEQVFAVIPLTKAETEKNLRRLYGVSDRVVYDKLLYDALVAYQDGLRHKYGDAVVAPSFRAGGAAAVGADREDSDDVGAL